MSIKDRVKEEAWNEIELTEQEMVYITFLHQSINQQIAGFLSTIATNRFDYSPTAPLQFDFEPSATDRKIKIRNAPTPES